MTSPGDFPPPFDPNQQQYGAGGYGYPPPPPPPPGAAYPGAGAPYPGAGAPYPQPYPVGYPGGYPMPLPDHPQANTAMILGILGLVCCQFLAPFALITGRKSMQEIDASGGRYGGRGQAQAGFIMGIIGSALLVLGVLYFIFMIAVMGVDGVTSTH